MNSWKRPQSEPAAVETTRTVHRRTVARGAVWAAPVALVAVSAPAFAASTSCLTAKWTEAVYSGAGGKWSLCFDFFNCGTADIKVTKIDVYTTYDSSATNNTANQLVHTIVLNTTVGTNATAYQPGEVLQLQGRRSARLPRTGRSSCCPSTTTTIPPDTDDEIDCVAKDGRPGVTPPTRSTRTPASSSEPTTPT